MLSRQVLPSRRWRLLAAVGITVLFAVQVPELLSPPAETFTAANIVGTATITTPTYVVNGTGLPTITVCNANPPTAIQPVGSLCMNPPSVSAPLYTSAGGGTWNTVASGSVSGTANKTAKFTATSIIGNAWATDDGTTWGVAGKFTIAEATGAAAAQELDGTGTTTATAISGTVNDWDPAGTGDLNGISIVREAPTAALEVTGLVAGHAGQLLIIRNFSTTPANTITIDNLNGGSTAANQFTLDNAANAVVTAPGACALRYSGTSSTWEPISGGGCLSTLTALPNASITVTDTGTVQDYNPPGLANASLILFNNASTLTVDTLSGGRDGRQLTVCAINTAAVTFVSEFGVTATSRFNFASAASVNLSGGGAGKMSCGRLIYVGGTVNRWTNIGLTSSPSQTLPYTYSSAIVMNAGASIQGQTTLSGTATIRCASLTTNPVLTSCGTGAALLNTGACATSFTLTTGTGATGCVITFPSIWGSFHPVCVVQPEGGAVVPAITYTSTTILNFGAGTAASTPYDVHCIGQN